MDARVRVLLGTFAQHVPLDHEERAAIALLRELVTRPEDPFARTTLPTHITASAVVLDAASRTILLHLHRRLDRWLQPGGHIERNESPADAAVRETVEETGIAVTHPPTGPRVIHLDEHEGPDGHIHLDLRYLLQADREASPLTSGERSGDAQGSVLRWVDLADVASESDRSLGRAVAALTK